MVRPDSPELAPLRFPRLDWTLYRPARPVDSRTRPQRVERSRRQLDQVEGQIEAFVREARRRVLREREVEELVELEERLDGMTLSACEAVHAPRVEDDPDWESRLVDEFAGADTDLELEEYLEIRKREFDCDRCPFASEYSLYPQDPCEMSLGPLYVAVADPAIKARFLAPMGPEDMRALADTLDVVIQAGGLTPQRGVDVQDMAGKAVEYLRLWAKVGFGILPELVANEPPIQTPEGIVDPATTTRTLLH